MKKIFISKASFTVLFLILISGCGENTGNMSALIAAPSGFQFTYPDGDSVTAANDGDIVQIRTTSGLKIFEFIMGRTTVALYGASFGRDDIGTLIALQGISSTPNGSNDVVGLPETITGFVPCNKDSNSIRICPNEISIPDDAVGCSGEVILTSNEPVISGYSWLNSVRADDSDCEIGGETVLFNSFYGESFVDSNL